MYFKSIFCLYTTTIWEKDMAVNVGVIFGGNLYVKITASMTDITN